MTERPGYSPDQIMRGLSLPRRVAHVTVGLGGLAAAATIGLLWATEPGDLPLRTRIAFTTLIAIGLAWAGFAGWALARRLVKEGAAGVLVPSYAPGAVAGVDINAVFWRWSTAPPHQVRVVDDTGRLPTDDRSWPSYPRFDVSSKARRGCSILDRGSSAASFIVSCRIGLVQGRAVPPILPRTATKPAPPLAGSAGRCAIFDPARRDAGRRPRLSKGRRGR